MKHLVAAIILVIAPEGFPFLLPHQFRFEVSSFELVALRVYDLLGREVATLVNDEMQPGSHEVTWDATGHASGVYYYRLQTRDFASTKKLVLLR